MRFKITLYLFLFIPALAIGKNKEVFAKENFDIINLNSKGLEEVKKLVDKKSYDLAAKALLK